jgi:hypothetical protein
VLAVTIENDTPETCWAAVSCTSAAPADLPFVLYGTGSILILPQLTLLPPPGVFTYEAPGGSVAVKLLTGARLQYQLHIPARIEENSPFRPLFPFPEHGAKDANRDSDDCRQLLFVQGYWLERELPTRSIWPLGRYSPDYISVPKNELRHIAPTAEIEMERISPKRLAQINAQVVKNQDDRRAGLMTVDLQQVVETTVTLPTPVRLTRSKP